MTRTFSTLTLLCLSALTSAQATTITAVNSRAALQALGLPAVVEWGTALDETGDPLIGYSAISSPSSITVTPSFPQPLTTLFIAVEGSISNGNFTNGDVLLVSNLQYRLNFSSQIQGFGFQIQRLELGAFTATMTAFTSIANAGTVTVSGNSTLGNGNNSAPFLGFLASARDIVAVEISVNGSLPGGSTDFAINRGTILTTSNAVPEPQTISMIGCGVAALAFLRRRK